MKRGKPKRKLWSINWILNSKAALNKSRNKSKLKKTFKTSKHLNPLLSTKIKVRHINLTIRIKKIPHVKAANRHNSSNNSCTNNLNIYSLNYFKFKFNNSRNHSNNNKNPNNNSNNINNNNNRNRNINNRLFKFIPNTKSLRIK